MDTRFIWWKHRMRPTVSTRQLIFEKWSAIYERTNCARATLKRIGDPARGSISALLRTQSPRCGAPLSRCERLRTGSLRRLRGERSDLHFYQSGFSIYGMHRLSELICKPAAHKKSTERTLCR